MTQRDHKLIRRLVLPICLMADIAFGLSESNLGHSLAAIQKNAPTKKDFRVKVEQSFYSSLRKKTKVSQGTLQFSPPMKFRWALGEDLFVYNGDQLWKYDAKAKHAAKLGADKLNSLSFLDAIVDPVSFAKQYDLYSWSVLSMVAGESVSLPESCRLSSALCLRLVPKTPGNIQVVFTALNLSGGWVEDLVIIYQDGNKALLKFSSYELEKSAGGIFDFVPPVGTAVDKF